MFGGTLNSKCRSIKKPGAQQQQDISLSGEILVFFLQQLPLIIVKFSIENRSLSVRGETDEKQLLVS